MVRFSRSIVSAMEWLNYHHLLYFWTVAREGGLGPASKVLRLAPPTLSGQIRALEESLGEQLFTRKGRSLVLTDVGHVVARYADEIFALGRELQRAVHGQTAGRLAPLNVGIVDVVPKLVVRKLLDPALRLDVPVRLVCHEDTHERLLARLASHEIDVLVADGPVPAGTTVKAYNHLLGECGVTFFGEKRHAKLRRGFPESLDDAPILLPIEGTLLRRSLDHWFSSLGIRPRVVAEFEDSALLKVFGHDGVGVFAGASAVEREIKEQYGVEILGRVESVRERFYAISAERRLKHPAIVAISQAAKHEVFKA
jgi:LysR family transcriptional regulator, transcriptional activator of nhaA